MEPTELGIGVDSETYGRGIAADEDRLTLLKLWAMDPTELHDLLGPGRHGIIQQTLEENANHGSEIDALAAYIKRLWADGFKGVEDFLPGLIGLQFVETRFIFGVPAIWKQGSIDRMEQAIDRSGILAADGGERATLDFVHEPLAAAMAIIPDIPRGERPQVRVRSPPFTKSSPAKGGVPCHGTVLLKRH